MNDAYGGPDTDGEAQDGEGLFADLGHFETGAIPVDATVRQGRAIRTRRRVIGSGMLAIAAALSIGVPVAIAGGGSSAAGAASGPDGVYAAVSSGPRITVNPTPLVHGKGQFSGAVDGKKWSIGFDNKNCYDILWACGSQTLDPSTKYGTLGVNATVGNTDDYTLFTQRDVASVTVVLQDGEVLHLETVPVNGTPVVLFALPPGLGVSKIVLFDGNGAQLGFSAPFTIKGSFSAQGRWYKPGETPPPAAGPVELARGTMGGDQIVMTAYTGPSGPCIVSVLGSTSNADCIHTGTITGSSIDRNGGVGEAASGLVAPNIARLQLDFADGTNVPVPVKSLGGYRFFAYIVPSGKQSTGVTAFDAAGKALPVQTNTQYNAG
ncbi:hypothetical protein Caci_0270 [Catenulispora acidiphila DSM 44928]|uniref:Uncharacterized protein n=1 Tax=Catenulispora acidiphila (strain DSM 44928 / JCM 14897 / NBRC 102108 / NRRL B-24433 / ID139908) TaxID=479433 RepID=C7QJ81_CATAD|nr:hypothetical protein [Catenulispora acidiphila]ACU69223.1 hypothetical protein Caci_0270 [Catenulispora acidiphila DSM 44928]